MLDDFQDFDCSAGIFSKEEQKAKLDDIQVIDKINDGLLAGKMESLDRIVKRYETDASEHNKNADVGLGLSDSLSLSSVSEPPDIQNWFSSYLYESPLLDTEGISEVLVKSIDLVKSCEQTCQSDSTGLGLSNSLSLSSVSEPPDIQNWFSSYLYESPPLDTEGISEVLVKSIDLVKSSKQTCQSESTDGQKHESIRIPHELDVLASERISQLPLPEQKIQVQTHSHDSVEGSKNVQKYGKENNTKSDSAFMHRTTQSHIVGNVQENYAVGQEGICCPSIKAKDNAKKSPSKEGNLGIENSGTAFPENGFVSTRKCGERANTLKFTKPQRVQSQARRKGVQHGPDHVESTNTRRKVLSETTNFHSTNALEIMGKWCCPQRNKPNLGPPLKQVRLEQWVRRV